MVFCTEPPATPCPCWTAESLDATFPPGYFDENGRGGAVCVDLSGPVVGIAATDVCVMPPPGGGFELTRSGAGVVEDFACALYIDLDPGNTGGCSVTPNIISVTTEQAAACVAALQGSQIYQTECP